MMLGLSVRSLRQFSSGFPSLPDQQPQSLLEYASMQSNLPNKQQAPIGSESFKDLRSPNSKVVFRDFTPFFKFLNITEPSLCSHVSLIRGRLGGKTTLGTAWLAYLRKEEELFKGTAVEHQMRKKPLIGVHLGLSEQTTLAGVVDHFGKQIREGMERANLHTSWTNPLPSLRELEELNPRHLKSRMTELTCSLSEIQWSSKLKFALFIDDCDSLFVRAVQKVLQAPTKEQHEQALREHAEIEQFFGQMYTVLKASGDVIPFQFVAGSSHLPWMGLFPGMPDTSIGNESLNSLLVGVLGYSWQQIEQCFPTQLRWLEHLHDIDRDQLRRRMEEWYGGHALSDYSSEQVFNPYSVHQFIRSGKFDHHWSKSGTSSRLVDALQPGHYSTTLLQQLTRAVTAHDGEAKFQVDSWSDLRRSMTPVDPDRLADNQQLQLSMLMQSGMLAFHPDTADMKKERIYLRIPNHDAKHAILGLLAGALKVSPSFTTKLVEPFFLNHDLAGLLGVVQSTGAFKAASEALNNKYCILSKVQIVGLAFAYLLGQHLPPSSVFQCFHHFPIDGVGRDLDSVCVAHVGPTATTHILKFLVKAPRQTEIQSDQMCNALEQCLVHKNLARKVGEGDKQAAYQVLFSVVIFKAPKSPDDVPSRVVVVTNPFTEDQILALRKEQTSS